MKRRKVIKVITLYAATAFIIMEAAEIMLPRLGFPDWTVTFIIILLIVGFPITIILSWIFDVTPEGIRKTDSMNSEVPEKSSGNGRRRFKLSDAIITLLIIIVLILVYPKIFSSRDLDSLRSRGRIALAVLPFQNMTLDTTWNIWQSGIQNILISELSNFSGELTVRQMESVEYIVSNEGRNSNASISTSSGLKISKKLDTDVFIRGNIIKDHSVIRISTQLVDSHSGDVFKSFRVEAPDNVHMDFEFIDDLSNQVKDYLVLSQKQQDLPDEQLNLATTKNPEAYSYYARGKGAFAKRDWPVAEEYFKLAIQIDPDFTFAYILLSWVYRNSGNINNALETHQKVFVKKDSLPTYIRNKLMYQHAGYYDGPDIEIKYLKMLLESDDLDPFNHYDLAKAYAEINNYDEAIIQYRKALEIYKRWGTKPFWVYNYVFLGYVYHETEQYAKEKKIYNKAERDFPGDIALLERQAILSYTLGRTGKGNEYLAEYEHALKERSLSDAYIMSELATIYLYSKLYDKAEQYYRMVIEEYGQTPERLNDLALFLIDTEQDIEEGLGMVETALEADQENPNLLATKGWGLFKQGHSGEALQILKTAKDLNPIFDRRIHDYLQRIEETL
ncbi:MAG: tetratricopeptide repeat protein [Ignavibacteriaceae bacterium]